MTESITRVCLINYEQLLHVDNCLVEDNTERCRFFLTYVRFILMGGSKPGFRAEKRLCSALILYTKLVVVTLKECVFVHSLLAPQRSPQRVKFSSLTR